MVYLKRKKMEKQINETKILLFSDVFHTLLEHYGSGKEWNWLEKWCLG